MHKNTVIWADNFRSWDGQLFFGDQTGYYAFFPDKLNENPDAPLVSFCSLRLGDKEVKPAVGGVLESAIWDTKAIKLKYDQNIFSIDFIGMHYDDPGEVKYLFMLENFDNTWRSIGTDHTAYFFNVPSGNYVFHAKAIAYGQAGEKSISIIISPPWWKTWWAYVFYILCFMGLAFFANRFIRNRIIEKERIKSREKELVQAKEIEKAYNKLKATQAQLIQSEKMASLGELTAGIAHEIQNPLNFVNNFSEVNKELVEELKSELLVDNKEQAISIANTIMGNEEKINHHGKRADAIVKGMLQHSRVSTGQKEPTDINALVDEYLRLSYHGLRAKDKDFHASLHTDFDKSTGPINIIPQDIGRVLLNLFNNAFYAVREKKSAFARGSHNFSDDLKDSADKKYEPTISAMTKRIDGKVEISVQDNGLGISQKVLDKIFQPFFTTKPTGQGTGLGLSLSYDIVKAHGGEIGVKTKEGEGSEFIIQLPASD